MESEINVFLNFFSKSERITNIAFMQIIANGFEKKEDFYKLNEILKTQREYLKISSSEVEIFLSNHNIVEDLKSTLQKYNSTQKSLLVNMSHELLKYNGNKMSEHNFMITENCFEKLVNINPDEYFKILKKNAAVMTAFLNAPSKKEIEEKQQTERFIKHCKENPHFARAHLGSMMVDDKKSCYVATLAYGDINHPKVEKFRQIRDNSLSNNIIGRKFIEIYYKYSPSLVEKLKPYKWLNISIRYCLDLILFFKK